MTTTTETNNANNTVDAEKKRRNRKRALILMWYLLAAMLVSNVALCFTEGMSWIANAINIIVPAGLYMLLLSMSRRIGRSVWLFFPVVFFSAFEIVLLYLFGSSVIAVDMFLNIVTSNPSEMMELLGDMWLIVLCVFVLYLPLLTWGVIAMRSRYRLRGRVVRRLRYAGDIAMLAGILLMIPAYLSGRSSAIEGRECYNPVTQIFPVNATANLATAVQRYFQTKSYPENSAAFTYHATRERPDSIPELYVLIVGETSRAANWQLAGYERPTNPRLSRREGLVYYPYAMSESNTTHKSVPMILSSTTSENFDSIYRRKCIIQAFNETGFETLFISNQMRNHGLIDFMGEQAGETIFVKDTMSIGGNIHDMEMLAKVFDKIDSGARRRQFVLIHTYGSHFKYNDRYDDRFRRFTPDEPLYTNPEFRPQQINAYDNTILATDAFLDSLIGHVAMTGRPAAVIYASDHGEDIFDDSRERFLHASPVPTVWQLHVPMLVWTSPAYGELYPEAVANLQANSGKQVSSSSSFFQTAVDLAGIHTYLNDSTLSLANTHYREPRHLFLTDHNHPVRYKDAGMKPLDFEQLHRLKIPY